MIEHLPDEDNDDVDDVNDDDDEWCMILVNTLILLRMVDNFLGKLLSRKIYDKDCAGDKTSTPTLYIRVAPVSKTISTKGGGADDDEGDEPEEKAEDSCPLWSEEVGSLC